MRNKNTLGAFALGLGLIIIASSISLADEPPPPLDSAAIALIKQPYGTWRRAWDIELSAVGVDSAGFPDSIAVNIANPSDDVIEGSNPVFGLIIDGDLFGWGVVNNADELTVRLEPGEKTTLVYDLNELSYKRYDDSLFATDEIIGMLKSKPWKIRLTLSDHFCPKPLTESNLNVSSGWLEFGVK